MRSATAALCCVCTATAACGVHDNVFVDFASPDDRSEILFVQSDEINAYAVSLEPGGGIDLPAEFGPSDRPRLFALLFEHTLDELGLDAGRIEPPSAPFLSRPAAISARYFEREVTLDDAGTWTRGSTAAAPSFVTSQLVDGPDGLACIERGGCFAHDAADARVCIERCPAPPAPEKPGAPKPPNIVCPPGWTEVPPRKGVEATWCEPWPVGTSTCSAGLARFPGETSCAPLGPTCPADGWPTQIPKGAATLYVDSSAAPGADGTAPKRPLPTLHAAMDRAVDDTVVVLRTGSYRLERSVDTSLAVVGACVSSTRIETRATVTGTLDVRHVTLVASATVGFIVTRAAELTLRKVAFEHEGLALQLDGGHAKIERATFLGDRAVRIDGGRLDGQMIDAAVDGPLLEGSGDVHLTDVSCRSGSTAALSVRSGALWLERAVIEERPALIAEASQVTLVDVLLRDAPPDSEVVALDRVDLDLHRARIEGDGTMIRANAGRGAAEDVILAPRARDAAGLRCQGCDFELKRAVVALPEDRAVGVEVGAAEGGTVIVEDAVFASTSEPVAMVAVGVRVEPTAAETLGRAVLRRVSFQRIGTGIAMTGADVEVYDAELVGSTFGMTVEADGRPAPRGRFLGRRIEIRGGDASRFGLFASRGVEVDLGHAAVVETGLGVIASVDAAVRLQDFVLERNRVGIRLVRGINQTFAIGYDVDLRDGVIRDNDCGLTHTPFIVEHDFKRVSTRVRFSDNRLDVAPAPPAPDSATCPE